MMQISAWISIFTCLSFGVFLLSQVKERVERFCLQQNIFDGNCVWYWFNTYPLYEFDYTRRAV